ncbi:MAG TPA: hypothetical protein VNF75_05800 [Candidatus Dormibacteraeota bacterium]|nr:hypothetical protein [Candidatus Dormibacteraeota bacterium]
MANYPCHSFQANQVWLSLAKMDHNLLCWAKLLGLSPDFLLA